MGFLKLFYRHVSFAIALTLLRYDYFELLTPNPFSYLFALLIVILGGLSGAIGNQDSNALLPNALVMVLFTTLAGLCISLFARIFFKRKLNIPMLLLIIGHLSILNWLSLFRFIPYIRYVLWIAAIIWGIYALIRALEYLCKVSLMHAVILVTITTLCLAGLNYGTYYFSILHYW